MSAVDLIKRQATSEGRALLDNISETTQTLTDLMRAAHGGVWFFQLDHDGEFIVIRRSIRYGR